MEIKLWSVYKLTTNAKNDAWTAKELADRHLDPHLKGDSKYRYTVPIQKLRTINDVDIYLMFQAASNKSDKQNAFDLNGLIPLNNDEQIEGYILPINVRLGLSTEFEDEFTVKQGELGIVNENIRTQIFKACEILIEKTPRENIIKELNEGKYDEYTPDQLMKLVVKKQFDLPELHEKGIVSNFVYNQINEKKDEEE